MQEEQGNGDRHQVLEQLRQLRVQVKKDNRIPSLLVRPFVLHRLRQTERALEEAIDPPASTESFTYTYTAEYSLKDGKLTNRIVSAVPDLPKEIKEGLSAEAAYRDPVSGYEALKALTAQSQAALQSGDAETAARLASESLSHNTNRVSWYYGNIVHEANQILGLAAQQKGDLKSAGEYLLAAGQTPGSPQLDSFGPTMTLAQALLRQGEREVVLTYLDDVARFWAARPKSGMSPVNFLLGTILAARNTKSIQTWKNAIRRGEPPNLNRIA